MGDTIFRDSQGNILTARTFERLKQESNSSVQVLTNVVYNTPRDTSPAPSSSEALRPFSSRARCMSPLRRRSGLPDEDSPLTAWGGASSAEQSGAQKGGRPGTANSGRNKSDNITPPKKTRSLPKPKPAWSDDPVTLPAKTVVKQRIDSITASNRRQTTSRPGNLLGLKPSSHPTAPLKLTVPPLKLSMPAESSSPESRRYEVSGLAKPVSPMLRHSISVPEGEVHRQLPGLSRTGGMTPRSLVASGRVNSGRLGSPRAGSQSLAPLSQPARPGSGATASKTGSESSKPVIAFGKLLPLTPALQVAGRPHHGGLVSTEESLGKRSRAGSLQRQDSSLAAPKTELRLPTTQSEERTSPSTTSRLGKRRSSASGSRRASHEGEAPVLEPRRSGTPRRKSREDPIESSGTDVSRDPLDHAAKVREDLERLQSQGVESRGEQRRPTNEVSSEAQREARPGPGSRENPGESSTTLTSDRQLHRANTTESPRTGTPRRLHSLEENNNASSSSERAQVRPPPARKTPRSLSRLGTPREEAPLRPQGKPFLPYSMSARSRSGSGLIPPVPSTRDGWVKESSILAHSASEIAAHKGQISEIVAGEAIGKQTSLPASLLSPLSIQNRREILSHPGPEGAVVQCTILRDSSESKLFPTYKLFLEDPAQLMMAARKRKKSKTSNYILSMDEKDLFKGTFGYCGKVRSNFLGTQFLLYDAGAKPGARALDAALLGSAHETERNEVGMVRYQYNIMGTRGPRRMTVVILKLGGGGAAPLGLPASDGSMTERLKREGAADELLILKNKPPRWNEQLGAYCLNFGGRVTHASVKNFQLVSDEDPDRIILQFGKVGKDKFSMDFMAPMSAIQAFGVCLTSLDGKLACE